MEDAKKLLSELQETWTSSEIPHKEKILDLKLFVKKFSDGSLTLNECQIDKLISTLPTDFPGRRLCLELAKDLHRPCFLIDIIKTGDKHLVRRALGVSWLFQEGKSELTEPEIPLRWILPFVSFTTRNKIVKQVGRHLKNEELCQEICSSIIKCFGYQCAIFMIHSCPIEFIREKLIDEFGDNRVLPSDQVLLAVAIKDYKTAMEYLTLIFTDVQDKLRGHTKLTRQRSNYPLTLDYLWRHYPSQVWLLYESFDTDILPPLAWHAVKSLLKSDKSVITNVSKFSQLVPPSRKGEIAKYLGWTFPQFFAALFPQDLENFPGVVPSLFQWLSGLSVAKKFAVFNTAFEENYGCDILTMPQLISRQILEILPVFYREQIAMEKLDNGHLPHEDYGHYRHVNNVRYVEAYWMAFTGLDKSVPKLTEYLVDTTKANIRTDIAELLVYTCYINNRDVNALAEICKLIASKWVHGYAHMREKFLESVKVHFGYRKFNRYFLWESMEEILKISITNKEPVSKSLLEGLIEYHLKTQQPIDTFLNVIISKTYTEKYGPPNWDFLSHDPHMQKLFLRLATSRMCIRFPWEEGHLLTAEDSQWIRIGIIVLCETFSKWNKRNKHLSKKEPLSVTEYPWLMSRLGEIMMTPHSKQTLGLQYRLIQALKWDRQIRNGYFKSYMDVCPLAPIVLHFLKHEPRHIVANLPAITNFILHLDKPMCKTFVPFFIKIKKQCFVSLQEAIVTKCVDVVNDPDSFWHEHRNGILILSYLSDCKSYLELVAQHYPPDKPEEDDDDDIPSNKDDDFNMQNAILRAFSHVAPTSQETMDCLHCILKFCSHEDLNALIDPLTSFCLHGPAYQVVKFLKEFLLDYDSIIKLHAIRVIFTISPKTVDLHELLVYLWENESHHSIKEAIIHQMFQFLGESPSVENWGLLKGAFISLTGDDKDLLAEFYKLSNVIKIPVPFLPDYLLTCLEKFSKVGISTSNQLKEGILEVIVRFVYTLPTDFIEHLLKNILFHVKEPNIVQLQVMDLTVEYCLKVNSDLNSRGKALKGALKKLSQGEKWNYMRHKRKLGRKLIEIWKKPTTSNFPARQALHTLVVTLCCKSWKKIGNSKLSIRDAKDMFDYVIEIIEKNFTRQDVFAVWFFLKCARIFTPVHSIYGTNEGKVRNQDANRQVFDALIEAGTRFQRLIDEQVDTYGPLVVKFFREKIVEFFNLVDEPQQCLLHKEKFVYFIDGYFKPYASKDGNSIISEASQVFALQMMPVKPPQCVLFMSKYEDCEKMVSKLSAKITSIYLGSR